ncbi:MAG: DNA-binding response regulator [Bacteroidetes bacterium]|nr:MAG: DNA-binding response regulator [Bacteroidota bacterium]
MESFKLDVLVVEDNLSFALELSMMLEDIGYNVIGHVDNAAEALELILSKMPDIILMDHDIKGEMTGIELGNKIRHLDIPILYITSFGNEEHYEEAKKSNMIGYLVKPIQKYSLRSALELSMQNALLRSSDKDENEEQFLLKEHVFVKKKGVYHKVPIASIAYVSSNDNYSEITTDKGQTFVVRFPLSKMEEMLPSNDFMRIHRQYIICMQKIESVNLQDGVLMMLGKEIPISRPNRKLLSERLKMWS